MFIQQSKAFKAKIKSIKRQINRSKGQDQYTFKA